jgi:NAD(P)-dependent dehydrogenase (short-subunit alcohol dehydrogenase family)
VLPATPAKQPGRGRDEIAREAGCRFVSLDVASEDQVRAALGSAERAGGPIDILVLNAGMAQPVASIESVPSDAVDLVVDVDCSASSGG